VKYLDLAQAFPLLAIFVADHPEEIIELFDQEAMNVAVNAYPGYSNVTGQVHVRITDMPMRDKIRHLRERHLNVLVRVVGVVVRRTSVFPQLQIVNYNCVPCNFLLGPFTQTSDAEIKPGKCPACQKTGPFRLNMAKTIYQNYQKITLQESPSSVPAGRIPRQKEVILLHDLIDSCSPGEEVDITAIYKHTYDHNLNKQNGFPVFQTVLIANHVEKKDDDSKSFKMTEEDIQVDRLLSL
jgi:DNA replication licensing factor MCM2